MDGIRPVDPVKTKGSTTHQARIPSQKSHPRAKFVEPLTPLHRLARFKEIRDRNLARDRNLRKSIQFKRTSPPSLAMDDVMNRVGSSETKHAKIKSSEKLSNGNDAPSNTNGVEHATNGNGLNIESVPEQVEVNADEKVGKGEESPRRNRKVTAEENVEKGEESPRRNRTAEEGKENVIEPEASSEPVLEAAVCGVTVNEKEVGDELESDGGHESEGSSLDVVGESSSESLDLQVSRRSSEDASEKDPSSEEPPEKDPSSPSPQLAPPPEPDQPKVVTPEIVRRIRAGGRIGARRNLRGEHSTPAKRKLNDVDDFPSGKKARDDDGSTSSTGWQFFSPSKSFSRFLSPFKGSPKNTESPSEVDESMIVNVDDQSNMFEKISEQTAITLIEESQEKHAPKWCALM